MAPSKDVDYLAGRDLFDRLVRGDAMIGLIADVRGAQREMLDALWSAARRGVAPAFRTLGECYFAALRTIGAFEGIDPADADARPWSNEAAEIVDDNRSMQAAMRAYFEAGRHGDRESRMQLARLTRSSTPDNQRRAIAQLRAIEEPRPDELYQTALVHHWLGELEASAALHHTAADRGNADAMFELYIVYAQGLGVAADANASQTWLERAAAADHPRALYNLGAAFASGANGTIDLPQAAGYYRRAAERGNGRAAATLAVMILGQEIDGTTEDACEWLDRADDAGYATWEMLDAVGIDDPRGGG